MRKVLVVAERELRERWLFLPAGLVLGCVPLVLPAFGVSRMDSPLVGLVIALVLGGAAALVSGATMLARDASTQRLGFLFARPLSWPAIWAGKWAAAVALGGVTGLLAAIPWMAVYPSPKGGSWLVAMLDVQGTVFALSILVILVGIANLATTTFLSRSPWVIVDLGMVAVAVWGVRRYVPFLLCGASAWRGTLLVALPALALLLASAGQVAVGRTDLRRAHRMLSITFWACVLTLLLGAAGYLHWIFAAGPGDLRSSFVTGSDASRRWIEVVGSAERSKCFGQDLLVDTRSGRYLPQMTASVLLESSRSARGRQLVFAGRAELAARWVTGADGRSTALALVDLSADHPRLSRVTLEGTAAPRWSTLLRLSPSGATALLVGESGAASLFETRSGRGLASTTVPAGLLAVDAVFSSETEARVWLASKPVRRVLEVAVGGRALWSDFAMPASWPGAGPAAAYALTPLRGGSRVLSFDNGVRLRDGKTGALVATLVEGGKSWGIGALADGRITVTTAREGREWLAVFDPDGVRLREVDLGPAGPTTNSPEVAPGRVAVGVGRNPPGQTVVVDVDAGRIVERFDGLRPAEVRLDWGSATWGDPALFAARAGGFGFFRGSDGQLVRLDLATGERRVVAGRGAPAGQRLDPR